MSRAPIRFGTDGWRGVIADDFTFENVCRVAQATADYWNSQRLPRRAIVGFDNRFQSETFARRVAEVFSGNGITAYLTPVSVPTPALSFAIRDLQLCGGVMITASHNPPVFNGYKLKAQYAGSADAGLCTAVEHQLDRFPVRASRERIEPYNPCPAYRRAIAKLADLKRIRKAHLRIVTDSMHGSGGTLLAEMVGAKPIRAERDVLFGGVAPEPVERHLKPLCSAVRQQRADIGLATDGDADRLGVVDERGRYVSVQIVHALLLWHLLRHRRARPGLVVRAINSTVLVDRIAHAYGLEVAEVPVGFRWACQKMRQHDVLMAGEESGSFGFGGHIPERDGLLAALYLLECLAVTGKSVSRLAAELQREFGRSAYERVDLRGRFVLREPLRDLLGVPVVRINELDGIKYIAADDSWLMVRASGTEPVTRIYCEAASRSRVRTLLEWGKRMLVPA